jgi:ribosome-associated toxin RatA of RatAB toxin-antitoxin module
MAQADIQEIVSVEKDKLYQAIIRYEDYPKFVDGVENVQVERKGTGHARVSYRVNMMKEVNYTLDMHEEPEAGVVHWSLVESDSLRTSNGRWELKSAGVGKTDVKYSIEVDFKISVPGFILNRLVKGTLPSMLKSFVKQASSL